MEDSMKTPIVFKEGLPTKGDVLELTDGETHVFFVLDDLCSEAVNSDDVCRMFTRDSHHRALSVAMTYQNLYEQGKKSRSIALSTEYLVLFKNPRDNYQITVLGRQLFPGKVKSLLEVYKDATAKPRGYLLIDLTAESEEEYRLRSRVLEDEDPIIYSL
jgi:hypothetical protein